MQTIRLRVSNKIYSNLMWFLQGFKKDEIQVIKEDSEFMEVSAYLQQELEELEAGKAKLISIDELENDLEIRDELLYRKTLFHLITLVAWMSSLLTPKPY